MRTYRKISLIVAIALLFSGCQTLTSKDKKDTLRQTLRSYEATVRWGDLTQAYKFLQPELEKIAVVQKNLEGIRVTGYEVVSKPINSSETDIIQAAQIRYIYRDRQVVKTILDKQLWSYDADKRAWQRANPIPRY